MAHTHYSEGEVILKA